MKSYIEIIVLILILIAIIFCAYQSIQICCVSEMIIYDEPTKMQKVRL